MQKNKNISSVLKSVNKPGRYIGGEYNSVIKDKASVKCRFAFCFPDTYEIGMSHLGMKILYSQFNSRDDIWCERVFAPWVDMEEQMRQTGGGFSGMGGFTNMGGFSTMGGANGMSLEELVRQMQAQADARKAQAQQQPKQTATQSKSSVDSSDYVDFEEVK